jgi:hypothetical protein
MNTDMLAARIVDAIRNLPPWERGRWSPMVRTVKATLDHAVAEHEARIPIAYAKGVDE